MYEAQQDKLANNVLSLNSTVQTLEGATANTAVFEAMKTGAAALKNMHGEM